MRKKVTQRLVSGVLCLAMGITLISPVTSRAAETSEPTTQATTESASTETTTEVPVTTEVQVAPSEDVLFDHFMTPEFCLQRCSPRILVPASCLLRLIQLSSQRIQRCYQRTMVCIYFALVHQKKQCMPIHIIMTR